MSRFQSDFKNDSSKSIGFSFIKVYNLWHKQIKDMLKVINLTHPQFIVLASIGDLSQKGGEINQVDISKNADIDVMTVSTIIKNLEKAGLVRRKNSLIDTRAKAIELTKQGQEKLTEALPMIEQIDYTFFDALGEQKESFNNMLFQLTENDRN